MRWLISFCLAATAASAQTLNLTGPASPDALAFSATVLPSRADFEARGAAPLGGGFTASLRLGEFHFDDRLALFPGGAAVPRNLWTLDGSLSYARKLDGDRLLSLTLGAGSASDKLFHGIDETQISATAALVTKAATGDRWLIGLNFSTNRPVLNYIPLPIVAWLFEAPALHLDGSIGFPFATLRWRPENQWDALLAVVATNVTAEAGFRPVRRLRLSAGYYWGQILWAPVARADTSSRLIYDWMRAAGGAEMSVGRVSLQLAAGYAFDTRVFLGTGEFDSTAQRALPSSWFATVALKLQTGSANKP
ncbi:MAG TPA: hypothetical protein VGH20_16985 [Myxococcales bacterium]|jgi:hypothetical protein